MDKQELEHKLEQARKDRELATAEVNKEVERLKKLLAEAEKPKPLEHGDYGYRKGQPRLLSFDSYGNIKATCSTWDSCLASPINDNEQYAILGNIFKELKVMSEPLEEFEKKSTFANGKFDVKFNAVISKPAVGINLDLPAHPFSTFTLEDLHEIIINLRRMEAKLAQEAKK